LAALEAAAPLVECAVKEEVSFPSSSSWSLIQRPTVEWETSLCGFVELIKREEELRLARNSAVRSMYELTQYTGQIAILAGQESIKNYLRGPECCAFLGRPSVNERFESDIETESRRIEAISHVLRSKKRAISVTHLRLSSRRERSAAA
jgi:hypothetical protein